MNTETLRHFADGGTVLYDPHFLSTPEADELLRTLIAETPWRQEKGVFGHLVPRLTAYYADDGVVYRYSGITHESAPWPEALLALRRRVEAVAGGEFNSLLLNYYRDGRDSMGYHADDEAELGVNPVVPSLSLGATRRFLLRHGSSAAVVEYQLTHGSLLVMGGTLQHHWRHAVPKTATPVGERVNLTFRRILPIPPVPERSEPSA
jgi:alkylated DNA repair dioxygenase AlkB